MNNDCEIVRDLCILVKEEACSESSKNLVKDHLINCSECKSYYDYLDGEIDIEKDKLKKDIICDNEDINKVKKYSRKIRRIIVLAVVSVIAVIMVYSILLFSIIFGTATIGSVLGESFETRNIQEYMKFNNIEYEKQEMNSRLDIFPKSINNHNDEDKYYYYCDNKGFLDNKYQMYLEKVYLPHEFELEKERLSKIEVEVNNKSNNIQYNEKDFNLPAYVAIYNDDCSYEYALVDENNKKIIYVYTRFMYDKDIEFDKKYLPLNFNEEMESTEAYQKRFSIYSFNIGSGIYDIIKE